MIGMETASYTSYTMRSAIGKTALPENPPFIFFKTGFFVLRSILMPSNVFIRLTASAPPLSQAFAISVMSVTFGESLIIIGFVVTDLTALVTSSAADAFVPNAIPPP